MTAAMKARNDLFLRWADEVLTPGMIRNRWNALPDERRIAVCGSPTRIKSVVRGMLVVNRGIAEARRRREAGLSARAA